MAGEVKLELKGGEKGKHSGDRNWASLQMLSGRLGNALGNGPSNRSAERSMNQVRGL